MFKKSLVFVTAFGLWTTYTVAKGVWIATKKFVGAVYGIDKYVKDSANIGGTIK